MQTLENGISGNLKHFIRKVTNRPIVMENDSYVYFDNIEEKVSAEVIAEAEVLLKEEIENFRISEIKSKAQSLILSKYSLEKQSSANLGLYGEEYLVEMKDYISNIIRISNKAELNGTKVEDIQWQ